MSGATPDVDVVVVGAGFGGLYALHLLREHGYSVSGIEAAPDVGGTWYFNRYPGARCDVPSVYYSYTWSPELRAEWRWTETYAAQPEILRYLRYTADRFQLRDLIRFATRVEHARFDEASATWEVTTNYRDTTRCRFLILATGNLSVPSTPKIPGLEAFLGRVLHTGTWPDEEIDFTGLRVGAIGTGSSGVQAIPEIAKTAKHLTVFQRTPAYSVPARNAPIGEAEHTDFDAGFGAYLAALNSPEYGRVALGAHDAPVPSRAEQWARYEELWQRGGGAFLYAFPNLLTNDEVNEGACEFLREKIRAAVHNPATADALCPTDYPFGVKRICVDTGYYETFNLPHVDLVNLRDDPLCEITETGVRTRSREVALDMLVLATGFDAMTGAVMKIDIRGRGGQHLAREWADGPRAYLGLTVSGFPNLFTITGPGSPSVIGNVVSHCEHHVEWLTELFDTMRTEQRTSVEADPKAEMEWMRHVGEVAERTLFPKANSWYLGANIPGKPRVFMPYVGNGYRYRCAEIAASGYPGLVFE